MNTSLGSISVVVPAINEAANLATLLPRLQNLFRDMGNQQYELLVVDGGSTDETVELVSHLGGRVVPEEGTGYGAAIKTGIRHSTGDIIICADADNSHPPDYVPRLLEAVANADLVIASRYVHGGSAEVSFFRRCLSLVLNGWYRFGLDMPYHDLSSGFRCYRRSMLEQLEVISDGYQFLPELLVRAHCAGFRVAEVPFHYSSRTAGSSHVRLLRFGLAYLACFARLWVHRNTCSAADYDWRGFYSRHPFQRYWQRSRHRHVLGMVGRDAGLIADVGCGASKILADLPQAIGIDVSLGKLRFMRRTNRHLVRGGMPRLPFKDETFDTVICSQVIEHIPEEGALEELLRICKGGGSIVIGTPDYGSWRWPLIEWLYGIFNPTGYKDEHITHYTESGLRERLATLGVDVMERRSILGAELILKGCKRPASAQFVRDGPPMNRPTDLVPDSPARH